MVDMADMVLIGGGKFWGAGAMGVRLCTGPDCRKKSLKESKRLQKHCIKYLNHQVHIKRPCILSRDELAHLELVVWGRMPTVLSWTSEVRI